MSLAKEIKYFFIQRLLPSPAYHLLRLYAKTIRLTYEGDGPVLGYLREGHRVLFACWHQRFFGGFYFPGRYQLKPCIMISRSRDGDFIAAVDKMDSRAFESLRLRIEKKMISEYETLDRYWEK